MKCHRCGKQMQKVNAIPFNQHKLDGWKCPCGEIYFNPEQVQKVLLLNKLEKQAIHATLGRNRSNLILRLPKDIETALNLHQGEEVILKIEKNELKVIPAE